VNYLGLNQHLSKFSPCHYYETVDDVNCKRLLLENCHLRNAYSTFTKEKKEVFATVDWYCQQKKT